MKEEQSLSNLNDLKGQDDDDEYEYDFAPHSFLADIALPPPLPADESSSEATHDQLPNVEEYKAQVGSSTSSNNRNCWKICFITALFVVAIIVSLTVGILIGIDEEIMLEEDIRDHSPTTPVSAPVSAAPVHTPVATPIAVPLPTLHPDVAPRYYEIETMIADQNWSDLFSLTYPGTPQNRAIAFMAEDDRQLTIEPTLEFKERYALAVLYYAWNGDAWRDNLFWMRFHHHCDWMASLQDDAGESVSVGVICNVDQQVTSIYLAGLEMRGTIPPEIGLLEKMVVLDLSGATHLESGPDGIPWQALTQLTNLRTLNLAYNNFTGFIDPRLNALRSLNTLNLSNNGFNGIIPTTIAANLRDLMILNLENNQLEGTLDPLQDCVAMSILLGGNRIASTLKEEIFISWPRLETLDLSDNQLNGLLPASLFAIKTLIVLDLHGNNLSGQLPDMISTDSNLVFLALQDNQLTGTIGDKYRYMEKLQHLDLSNNQFDGPIPSDFSMLPDLRYLFLAFNNNLSAGPIPPSYGDMMDLVDLSLQGTNRRGTIPTELGKLNELHLLDLGDNNLSGPIPSEIATMEKLRFLLLKDNKLTGAIPDSMLAMQRLQLMVINENPLVGTADEFCNGDDGFTIKSMDLIVADCAAFSCECCVCCDSEDGKFSSECITPVWFSDVDPVDSPFYRYQRGFYAFQHSEVQYPSMFDGIDELPIWNEDPDGDEIGNGEDSGMDGDGTPDPGDTDGDNMGDNADGDPGDSDGDGTVDNAEGAPEDENLGVSDGARDNVDALPNDPNELPTDHGDDAGGVR